MKVLVHIYEDGRVFANYKSVSWLKIIEDKIYIAEHPGVAFFESVDPTKVYLRAPLSYEPWNGTRLAVDFASALSAAIQVNSAISGDLKAVPAFMLNLDAR